MSKRKLFTFLTAAILIAVALQAPNTVKAVSSATGVALSSYSDCTSPAGLDISMNTDATPTREGGTVTTQSGATLLSFDQSTGFQNFSGTFFGYNFASPAWSVPAGTVVGLHAYIGTPPYNSSNTIEWFIAYVCDTREIVASCYGDYGSCPQSAAGLGLPGPDLVPLPAGSAVGAFVSDTPLYFAPRLDALTGKSVAAGKTLWVTGMSADHAFYQVVLSANFLWVPVSTIGPNYDAVWNGTPLPTTVIQ